MNPPNKKLPGARGIPQPFNRHPGHVLLRKPVVAQLKTGVSAQSVKMLVAPPVYKPTPQQTGAHARMVVASAKTAVSAQSVKQPTSPSVYRPQAKPANVQATSRLKDHSKAPPASSRPQAFAKLLQTKNAVGQRASQKHCVVQLWRTVAGQDGEFEGEPAAHHLHRVGGDEHYRYGLGRRITYIHGGRANYANIEMAIHACTNQGATATGRAECLVYLQALLAETPRPAPVVRVETKKDPPPPPPPKGGGSKRTKRLNALGDALAARQNQEGY